MKASLTRCLAMVMLITGGGGAMAAQSSGTSGMDPELEDAITKLEKPLRARTTRGVIHSIDMNARKGIIGGFEYHFGPPTFALKVSMKNSSTGALELLQPGMKVEVVYGDFGSTRIAASIKVLPDNAPIEY
ncbi:MAG: hypothetical protein AAF525_09280 [Pseudomonadota bacterium]